MIQATVRTVPDDNARSHLKGESTGSLQKGESTRAQSDKGLRSSNGLLPLSAVENVELPLLLTGISVAEARSRAREALDLVGLADKASRRPPELSRDQRQRLIVARSLANKPAFDYETSAEAMEALCRLVNNRG